GSRIQTQSARVGTCLPRSGGTLRHPETLPGCATTRIPALHTKRRKERSPHLHLSGHASADTAVSWARRWAGSSGQATTCVASFLSRLSTPFLPSLICPAPPALAPRPR